MPRELRVSLGEGDTALEAMPELASVLGLESLWVKREDNNPTGSHKDRGLAYQVSALRDLRPDLRWLVISSSGNAAISAAAYGEAAGYRVATLISPRTPAPKRALLAGTDALVLVSDRALTLAGELADAIGAPNLRPSVDPLAPIGFQTIGWEILEAGLSCDPPPDSVFTFASSGASLVGIGRALSGTPEDGAVRPPALHVVQGTGAHPIAGEYDPRDGSDVRGRVGALGAPKTRRVGEAKRLVNRLGGRGWVIRDEEADRARALLESHGIDSSLEGAAALAAAGRAARESEVRRPVVVITGARRTATLPPDVPTLWPDERPVASLAEAVEAIRDAENGTP